MNPKRLLVFGILLGLFFAPILNYLVTERILFEGGGGVSLEKSLMQSLWAKILLNPNLYTSNTAAPAGATSTGKKPVHATPLKLPVEKKKLAESVKPAPASQKSTEPMTAEPRQAFLTSQVVYSRIDTAVVQIICHLSADVLVTGSGFVISADGLILTNAHVVEGGTDCVVKTGDPAQFSGNFKILYAGDSSEKIEGTSVSKRDYAIGKITELSEHSLFHQPFWYLKLNTNFPAHDGDRYYLAAYSSELIGSSGLRGAQNLVFSSSALLNLYLPGIMELAGNISTQEGASGSPVISPVDASVIGLVFGQDKSQETNPNTSARTEFAFTMSSIASLIQKDTGKSLAEFLSSIDQ